MSELPQGWGSTGFLDVLNIEGGGQPPKSTFVYEPKVGYVQLLQIRDFGSRPVPTYIPDTDNLKKCVASDVLIARYGASIGRILTGLEGAYNVAMAKVVIPDGIDRNYVRHLLQSELFQAPLRLVSRSAQNGFNKEDLAGFEVVIAPEREQSRIANQLDTLLARVQACNDRFDAIPALLKRFRQTVLAEATSGALTEAEETAGSAAWTETTIGAVSSDLRYGTSKKCDYSTQGTGVLRIPNIAERGRIDVTDLKRAAFDSNELEKLALREGDLLVIRSNGSVELVGKTGLVTAEETGLLFAGYLMRLRVNPEQAVPAFIQICLSAPIQRQYIERTAKSTSGVNNLNAEELRALPLLLPSLAKQIEIVSRVKTLFALADRIEARCTAARTQAQRLTPLVLAKAFRGELVAQDPNDELASALLARIGLAKAAADKPEKKMPIARKQAARKTVI